MLFSYLTALPAQPGCLPHSLQRWRVWWSGPLHGRSGLPLAVMSWQVGHPDQLQSAQGCQHHTHSASSKAAQYGWLSPVVVVVAVAMIEFGQNVRVTGMVETYACFVSFAKVRLQ